MKMMKMKLVSTDQFLAAFLYHCIRILNYEITYYFILILFIIQLFIIHHHHMHAQHSARITSVHACHVFQNFRLKISVSIDH